MAEYPSKLYHDTPAWVRHGAPFHVRLRAARESPTLTNAVVGNELLQAVRRYHELGHWWCELFLLMPDHVHAIIAFPADPGMSLTIKNWKRGSARFQGIKWQEGYFDHRLRSQKEYSEKWSYIRQNPVVKNLCLCAEEWPWWWSPTVTNAALEK